MARLYVICALIAFGYFNVAQYRGWTLFGDDANAQAVRDVNSLNRSHK